MPGRRPSWRAIRRHYSYTAEEAAFALGVAKGSIRRWIKNGLPHIADQRPYLILGSDLIDFLQEQRKPKQRCAPHEFFCFRCRLPRAAAGGMIDYQPKTSRSGQLSAICETCGTIMHKNFSAAGLGLLGRHAEVSFPKSDPRLNERGNPRLNDHFEKEPST